jgi:N-methylhydantoinase B
VRADGSGSRSIILGGRSTYTGKGYVQYEIIAGGAGARASKDGASGITVNQSNARIAPIEIIESEFPTRITCFELIADSAAPVSSAAVSASAGNISTWRTPASRSAP